ncbi:hypothetical protein E3N88_04897 [Mikania micrantha]|uniref:Dof zinc finger protein n=1 Tax=Mikania micrantha TaxID=192012 RepID=A0A5N6PVQ8_9ASTR|nr:hypothetical protein E3N88_04897 [Mikania micrantha]
MLSNNIGLKEARKDENQTPIGGRKTSSQRPPEQTLRCPRCDSTNTKFCYYNNYNLTQPRYFCKTCRRYWTKGGALRNIPIGGGCRKNKKTKSCSSKFIIGSSSSSSDGVSAPVMDFQLGGMNYPHRVNQFSSNYGENTLPFMNLDPLGFNHNQTGSNVSANFQEEMGFPDTNLHHNLQSLSSLNQDLHWKLQQQRLAMLIGGVNNGYASGHDQDNHHRQHHQKESGLQPILFQNLETSRKEVSGDGGVGGLSTELLFDNHFAPVNMIPLASSVNDQNGNIINNWNGNPGWNDHMNHYNPLP